MVVPAHQKPEGCRRPLDAGWILEFRTVSSVVGAPRSAWSVGGQNDDDLAMSVANSGGRAGNASGCREKLSQGLAPEVERAASGLEVNRRLRIAGDYDVAFLRSHCYSPRNSGDRFSRK